MPRRIICRFRNQEDINTFVEKTGYSISKNTKQYLVDEAKTIEKPQSKARPKKKEETWREHWWGMPEYLSEKQEDFAKIEFIFSTETSKQLSEIFDQNISDKTLSIWYPKLIPGAHSTLRCVGKGIHPRYPIYIVSKNRSDKCYTSRFLTQMEVHHFVVVEPQDYALYKERVENEFATIIELDMSYKTKYDTCDNFTYEENPRVGPGAARNFCWDDSIKRGAKWHWVFDDNATEGFHVLNRNNKIKCRDGSYFSAIEDFVDRYDNIAIAGLNYTMFCLMKEKYPPYVLNTRIYSFLLINNEIKDTIGMWRGRYNEDTDLSLRVLKQGLCTIQFNSFTGGKATTQKVSGGNTAEFYSEEGTYPKSKMLQDLHPDVAKVVWKFHRWHHYVDYSGYKQQLHYRDGIVIPETIETNNYGMQVIRTVEDNTYDCRSYLLNKYKPMLEKNIYWNEEIEMK